MPPSRGIHKVVANQTETLEFLKDFAKRRKALGPRYVKQLVEHYHVTRRTIFRWRNLAIDAGFLSKDECCVIHVCAACDARWSDAENSESAKL
jgi:hypothetical protein